MPEAVTVLILGGTTEAAPLARSLASDPSLRVVTSLAGRTRAPAALAGEVRSGGFGGAAGLATYLRDHGVGLLIDATHPFAAVMPHHAAAACERLDVPRLRLLRPAWTAGPGDRWIDAPSLTDAATLLPDQARRVFLATGRQGIEAFANDRARWFLVRLIDRPADPLPLVHHELVLGRGPFEPTQEVALMTRHKIDTVVTKNSGGTATYGKIAAARELGLPVVVVARPPQPAGETLAEVDDACAWVAANLPVSRRGGRRRTK